MKLLEIDNQFVSYLDGGTIRVKTTHGETYFIDRRLNTNTEHRVYDAYPDENHAKIVDNITEKQVLSIAKNYMIERGYFDKITLNIPGKDPIIEYTLPTVIHATPRKLKARWSCETEQSSLSAHK